MANPVKVSVVVPVYNTAPYLEQCLDSIVGQSLADIEIICVDDGSTDESPAILESYVAKDLRLSNSSAKPICWYRSQQWDGRSSRRIHHVLRFR